MAKTTTNAARKSTAAVPASPAAAELEAVLATHGCRYTSQRGAVYDYLKSVDSHPTADEVYQAVRGTLPHISLATVYKALETLVAAGVANKLCYGDDAARYDCRQEGHYHVRDVATGEVYDLPATFDPALLDKLDPQLVDQLGSKGFRVTGYRLEVLGHFED
jgi:Fe2+ or Zn2+ uptake regulation protein